MDCVRPLLPRSHFLIEPNAEIMPAQRVPNPLRDLPVAMSVGKKDGGALGQAFELLQFRLHHLLEIDDHDVLAGLFGQSSDQLDLLAQPFRVPARAAVAKHKPVVRFDFVPNQFGQERIVSAQTLEKKQQRVAAAPFEFVADLANFPKIAVRVGDENTLPELWFEDDVAEEGDARRGTERSGVTSDVSQFEPRPSHSCRR